MQGMTSVKKASKGRGDDGRAARIRAYLQGLTVKERKRCAEMCGVSLYTLSGMMRKNPRNVTRISPSVAQGLHVHSNGLIDKAQIRGDLYGAGDEAGA